jgi:hypothetical protein
MQTEGVGPRRTARTPCEALPAGGSLPKAAGYSVAWLGRILSCRQRALGTSARLDRHPPSDLPIKPPTIESACSNSLSGWRAHRVAGPTVRYLISCRTSVAAPVPRVRLRCFRQHRPAAGIDDHRRALKRTDGSNSTRTHPEQGSEPQSRLRTVVGHRTQPSAHADSFPVVNMALPNIELEGADLAQGRRQTPTQWKGSPDIFQLASNMISAHDLSIRVPRHLSRKCRPRRRWASPQRDLREAEWEALKET